jgi:catechol 2,3-dioxygenase
MAGTGTSPELQHVVLYVRNVARSAAFYRDVVGMRQVMPKPDPSSPTGALEMSFPAAMFSSGRTHHELLLIEVGEDATPIPRGRRVGMYHFGIKVGDTDDELRAALARVEHAGASIVGSSDHGFTHSLYLMDPDGNELELFVDVPGMDWDDPEILTSPPQPLRL